MTSVITADIINSRKSNPKTWLVPIKKLLSQYGKFPQYWDTSRGDSFQVEIKEPEKSLLVAATIKALIRSLGEKELDVRIAIGIGDKTYSAPRIGESTGSAFINAGERFESLKKIKQNLAIKTEWENIDAGMNLMLQLALIVMDKWTVPSAEMAYVIFNEIYRKGKVPSQKELEKKFKLKQSSISERQKRAHTDELIALEQYYRDMISQKL